MTTRNKRWMCLFLKDLKVYAVEQGLQETAAAIDLAISTADREISRVLDASGEEEDEEHPPSSEKPGKLQ